MAFWMAIIFGIFKSRFINATLMQQDNISEQQIGIFMKHLCDSIYCKYHNNIKVFHEKIEKDIYFDFDQLRDYLLEDKKSSEIKLELPNGEEIMIFLNPCFNQEKKEL